MVLDSHNNVARLNWLMRFLAALDKWIFNGNTCTVKPALMPSCMYRLVSFSHLMNSAIILNVYVKGNFRKIW